MVVYRKEPNNLDPLTGTTAAVEETTANEAGKNAIPQMAPRAILTSRPNSHPFRERELVLDQPIKVGRSVARCRPAVNNAIFDCKVLSRNHALLWYENGKFYLQDTKSSNGTFVNNQRLSKGSEESPAREVCSGDIVQFGVDVVENPRKVVHGCIVATLKLYLPDGKEAKASPTTTVVPLCPETAVSSQELYQLSQYLQEALHREQILENKLGTLSRVVANTQDESDIGWKALIEEDRLLSRIETLESQLQTCGGKNVTEEKLKDDVVKLQEDKDKYQLAAKESLKKVLQEKLEAIRKIQDLENSLSNTENECSHLMDINQKKEQEIELLLDKAAENEKEIGNLTKKLEEIEEKYQNLINQTAEDKIVQETNAEEMRKGEQLLSTKIEALKAENDFAKEQLNAMKAHFDILKKDQTLDSNVEANGNLSTHDKLNSTKSETTEKNLIQVLSCEVNRLELELQRVQKENFKNESLSNSETDECTSNGDAKPPDYVNKLQADVQHLKKLLSEARDNKKLADSELLHAKSQLEEAERDVKSISAELQFVLDQLLRAKQELKEKTDQAQILENKLLSLSNENDPVRQKEIIQETLNELQNPSQSPLKDSQENITSLVLSKENEYVSFAEYETLKKNCVIFEEQVKTLETDLMKHVYENSRLEAQSKLLITTCSQLEAAKANSFESDPDSQDDLTPIIKSDLVDTIKKLLDAQEEITLIKERYEECNKEKSYLQSELNVLKEQLQLLSVQSKTVSVCSIIPLIILAVAVMLAFYPTLAHLTATSDHM
ncbi:sarcolemmal membrane-associated protein [Parasteatoda tepidariorum]|uniref:sarcolemmal membrane-associated protein n=1 Tax=Parasteatoda tepidariorum TaxID=114398 RepID=UPI00077FBBD0|nr:sarcolemmal membrane-associated protein [Parasteatoda tepidariorum]